MALVVKNIAFDCADPYTLALFWSEVLSHPIDADDQPGDPAAAVERPGEPAFYFERVPEEKAVKNRVHVCLQAETERDAECERVLALGASMVRDHRRPDGTGWVVLADPEGNEFCVLGRAA